MFSSLMVLVSGITSLLCYILMCFSADLVSLYSLMVIGVVFASVTMYGLSSGAQKSKGVLAYMVVQVMGANLILVGLSLSDFYQMSSVLVLSGFLIKVGLFPFHMWVPYVFPSLGWQSFFPGLVLYKLGLVLSMPMCVSSFFLFFFLGGSFIWGALGAILEGASSSLKKVVSWMSISDSAWMVCGKLLGLHLFFLYVLISGLIMLLLSVLMSKGEVESIESFSFFSDKLSSVVILMTYAGLPPFVGSVPKVIICCDMMYLWPSAGHYLMLSAFVSSVFMFNQLSSFMFKALGDNPFKSLKNLSSMSFLCLLLCSSGVLIFVL